MRQNLTNIAAKDLESLEHFYIVGSTTKEGLLDESTNVKIDLKKELAEAGGGEGGNFNIDDIVLAEDLLDKCRALNLEANTSVATDWTFSDICAQDSNGLLQQAFEEVELEEDVVNGVIINDTSKGLFMDMDTGTQAIRIVDTASSQWTYIVYYDIETGTYSVRSQVIGLG